MESSKIISQNRLSFIKNVSQFPNYSTRIMKLIPSTNLDDSIDDIFDNGEENRFFFALYSTAPVNVKLFREESESLQLLEHPSLNKYIAIGANLNSDSPNSILSALYQDIPYYTICSKLPTLNHTQKLIIVYGVASALQYLQSNNIFFYNLNTSQMHLNKESEPIIDGYGLSCFQPSFSDISFVAPELLAYVKYYKHLPDNSQEEEDKCDIDLSRANIYSFGYFMIEILTEKKPVLLRRASDRYFYSYPKNLSKQYDDLVSNCINFKPEERLTFDDILLRLQEIANENAGICTDFFKLYASKFTKVKLLSLILPVFNYPLSCFVKTDSEESDDDLLDFVGQTPNIESNYGSKANLSADKRSEADSNANQKSASSSNKDLNTNSDTKENTNAEVKADTKENANSSEIINANPDAAKKGSEVDTNQKDDGDSNKRVTMPTIGVPRIRYRQNPSQAKSARNKQYQYSQINGQNYCNQNMGEDTTQQRKFRYIPGTARPINSINLAQIYSRSSGMLSCKSTGNCSSNYSRNVPLISFREFQSRMFPQDQTPNISFIQNEGDVEILKKRSDPDSQYILGYYYETKDRFEDAYELYKSASARGHSQALYREGLLLMNGRGCKQNMRKASKFFLQSAKQRNTDAAYQFILIHGPRNDEEKKNESNDQFEIKMPKEPNTTRTGKSGRNLRKTQPQTQNQAQSARVVHKKSFSKEDQDPKQEDKKSTEAIETETAETKNEETETNNFTIDSLSNSSNSTESNSTETTEEVDIENELKICMNYLQYSADIGFADSIFKLAILNEQGIGFTKDLNRAFILYKRAADRGVIEACFRTASMMLEGRGTPRAFNEAAFYLQKASRKGHLEATFKCGQLFENGLGVTKNIEKAAEFYREASSKGHVSSKRSYARIIRETKRELKKSGKEKVEVYQKNKEDDFHYTPIVSDDKLAFKLMKEAADAGDNEALSDLGEMYRDGFGTQKNLKNAFFCFRKASSSSSSSRVFNSSDMARTNSVSASMSSSSSTANLTSENESSCSSSVSEISAQLKANEPKTEHFAMNNNSFYNDIVNGKTNNKGITTTTTGNNSANISRSSSSNIGCCCCSSTPSFVGGTSLMPDFLTSFSSSPSLDLVQKPSSRACVNLGLMYEQGLGTQIDLKKAVRYFRMSANMRDFLGQFHYARALENGIGLAADLKLAAKFYRLSANQGFGRAQFNIARYLEFGLGIDKDISLAIQFYKCAARQGIKAAEVALRRLKQNCL